MADGVAVVRVFCVGRMAAAISMNLPHLAHVFVNHRDALAGLRNDDFERVRVPDNARHARPQARSGGIVDGLAARVRLGDLGIARGILGRIGRRGRLKRILTDRIDIKGAGETVDMDAAHVLPYALKIGQPG